MKKTFIVFATTVVLASSIISTASVARGFGGFAGRGMERPTSVQEGQGFNRRRGSANETQRLLRLAPVLNLSEEQITEIEAIQEANKEQRDAIKDEMKAAHESLRELSQGETYDEEGVTTIATTIGNLVADGIILKSKTRFDISQVLTAEQRAQLEEIRGAFRGRHQTPSEDSEIEAP